MAQTQMHKTGGIPEIELVETVGEGDFLLKLGIVVSSRRVVYLALSWAV